MDNEIASAVDDLVSRALKSLSRYPLEGNVASNAVDDFAVVLRTQWLE